MKFQVYGLVTLLILSTACFGELWKEWDDDRLDSAIVKVGSDSYFGSGVIIGARDSSYCYILTADHIPVDRVIFHNGRRSRTAQVVDRLPADVWVDGYKREGHDVKLLLAGPYPSSVTSIEVAEKMEPMSSALVIGWGHGHFKRMLMPVSSVFTPERFHLGDRAFVRDGDSGAAVIRNDGKLIGIMSGSWRYLYPKSMNGQHVGWPPSGAGIAPIGRLIQGRVMTQICRDVDGDGKCDDDEFLDKIIFDDSVASPVVPAASSKEFEKRVTDIFLKSLDKFGAQVADEVRNQSKSIDGLTEAIASRDPKPVEIPDFPEFPEFPSQEPILNKIGGISDQIEKLTFPEDKSEIVAVAVENAVKDLTDKMERPFPVLELINSIVLALLACLAIGVGISRSQIQPETDSSEDNSPLDLGEITRIIDRTVTAAVSKIGDRQAERVESPVRSQRSSGSKWG